MHAGHGRPLTLVATDVEGSTLLWEWNRDAMMEAITIHDTLIRLHLASFHGYEVATEVSMQLWHTMNSGLVLDVICLQESSGTWHCNMQSEVKDPSIIEMHRDCDLYAWRCQTIYPLNSLLRWHVLLISHHQRHHGACSLWADNVDT